MLHVTFVYPYSFVLKQIYKMFKIPSEKELKDDDVVWTLIYLLDKYKMEQFTEQCWIF